MQWALNVGIQRERKNVLRDVYRQKLVGLVPVDGKTWIKAGAQLVEDANAPPPMAMLGHVTAIAFSPEMDMPIALALMSGGLKHEGRELDAAFPLKDSSVRVRIVSPHFIDPEGKRMHV